VLLGQAPRQVGPRAERPASWVAGSIP